MNRIEETAPAKINLRLRVLGRRPDGYHELDSWVVPIALYDQLTLQRHGTGVRVRCPGNPELQTPNNLAVRAASAWFAAAGERPGLQIEISKKIPVAAGLGGGSSDAAAVLRGLQRLAPRALPDPVLADLALDLGADVPFFLRSGPCRARGVGERLEPLADLPPFWLLLACAPFGQPTREVFESLRFPLTSTGDGDSYFGPRAWGLEQLAACLVNDLQPVGERLHPVLGRVREALLRSGASGALMSGSGPCVFGVFGNRELARIALRRLRREPGWKYKVVRGIHSGEHFTDTHNASLAGAPGGHGRSPWK